jgi:hypothetical protein
VTPSAIADGDGVVMLEQGASAHGWAIMRQRMRPLRPAFVDTTLRRVF